MSDNPMRVHVKRLINRRYAQSDLITLYLYLRNKSGGRETVQEIGDFVAHKDARVKGVVTNSVREWYFIAKMIALTDVPYQVNLWNLPTFAPEYLKATANRVADSTLKEFGLRKKDVHREVGKITSILDIKETGALSISSQASALQYRIVDALLQIRAVKPAFTGEEVYKEFVACLREQNLLSKEEAESSRHLRAKLTIFAVSVMSGSEIKIDQTRSMNLKARLEYDDMIVDAFIPVRAADGRGTDLISSAMFGGRVNPERDIEAEMLDRNIYPAFLEYSPTHQLRPLA